MQGKITNSTQKIWRILLATSALSCVIFHSAMADDAYPYLIQPDRFSFAQTYVSVDTLATPGTLSSAYYTQNNLLKHTTSSDIYAPSLTIGGSHFWGRLDFYVSFPFKKSLSFDGTLSGKFSPGVETGMRWYLWPKSAYHLAPFAGAAWSNFLYRQQTDYVRGPLIEQAQFPLQFGLSYFLPHVILDAGYQWRTSTQLNYPISRTESTTLNTPGHYFWLSARYILDTSIGARGKPGSTARGSAFIAIGPSATIPIGASPTYQRIHYPALSTATTANFFEYALGYELYDFATIALSYRPMTFQNAAYGLEQTITRKALALEAFHRLFDFHGFTPYLGVSLARDVLSYNVVDTTNSNQITAQNTNYTAGLLIGWDIRPIARQPFTLRTSLRLYPSVNIKVSEQESYHVSQLEFMFIQLVYMPGYH